MGVLLSRFRSKLSTKQILEDIGVKLKSIDEFQQDTIECQKRIDRRLLLVTIVVYISALLAFLFIKTVQKCKIYFFTGLGIFAIVIWTLHKGIHWYYNRQMVNNSAKSIELRKRKKKILEEVMNTETYKVAKEILDIFGDKPSPPPLQLPQSPLRVSASGTDLRQRQVEPKMIPNRTNAPLGPSTPSNVGKPPPLMQSAQRPNQLMHFGPARPLPRPILPRERGIVDRLMDFFVGDGPHQRYALICRHCGGHNGMALQEEFEYVSYGCCYCFQFNPPRKQRPMGPRLPLPPPPAAPVPTAPAPAPAPAPPIDIKKKEEEEEPQDDFADKEDVKQSESDAESETSEPFEPLEETSEKMDVDAPETEPELVDDESETSSLR